jgi:hypothetical protein
VNHGKVTSFILTEMEISAICKKVNLEVESIIHQHRELLIDGALFLDSLEIKLSIQKNMDKERLMRTFLAKPIQELLQSDENRSVKLIINGLSCSDLIPKLVEEGQPLNRTYSLLLDETLIKYSHARDMLALMFRKQLSKE